MIFFRLLDLLRHDPLVFVLFLVGMVIALGIATTVHEFSHGFVAYRQGDLTAKNAGRLSLNPLVHLDPLGTILLFIIGFGWGKPVPVNPFYLRAGPRKGMAMVAAAGAAANLMTAAVFSIPIRLGMLPPTGILWDILSLVIFYNIILATFNLIPIPPLDGFNVVAGLLPARYASTLDTLGRYGPALLLVIVAFDMITGTGLLWKGITPVVNLLSTLLTGMPLL